MSSSLGGVAITGGAQGIGKAIAKRLLEQGYRVFILDADSEAGRETEEELRAIGVAEFICTDIAQEHSIYQAFDVIQRDSPTLTALVNNAGIMCRKPLAKLSLDDWNAVLAVNLTGPMLCAKFALPLLDEEQSSIVNIASTRALMSEPNTEAYSASKGGLVALTHALALSFGPKVRVNCISPGWIDVTAWKKNSQREAAQLSSADHLQHPAGRVGTPDDIAALVAFLISREAAFITGANFVIDGGMTKKMIYAE